MARRPKISEIRSLAKLQCTDREAAGFFGLSVAKWKQILRYDKKAALAWEEGLQEGRISLRRKQFRLADTNASMATFLGKQYLGQHEVVINEHSGRDGGPINFDLTKLDASERKKLREILSRAGKDGSQ